MAVSVQSPWRLGFLSQWKEFFTVEGIIRVIQTFLAVELQLPLSLPVAGVQLLSFVWAVVAQALPPHAKQSSIW